MGLLLGYGAKNAKNFYLFKNDPEKKALLAPKKKPSSEWQTDGTSSNARLISMPLFAVWHDEDQTNESETSTLLTQYANERLTISTTILKDAFDSNNFNKNAVQAFFNAIFKT